MKLRLALWLLLSVTLGVAAKLHYSDQWLQTDIIALAEDELASLPDAAAVKQANQQFQQSLVWVLAEPEAEDAQAAGAQALVSATAALAEQLAESPYIESTRYRWAEDTQRADLWRFLQPLRGQLLTREDRKQLREAPEQFARYQLGFIYSPRSAGMQLDLERDPFFTFQHFLTSESTQASEQVDVISEGIPVYRQGNRRFTLLRSQAAPLDMRGSIHQPLQNLRTSLQQWANDRGLTLVVAGAPLHTEYAAAGAQREIRLIGGLSILLICLLTLVTFRSPRPLILSLFAIACGIGAGTAAVIALLGQMHILAFVFGTTVTGLAIDYAFHFICNRLRPGTPRDTDIMPGLVLGLLSSCLAFFALALSPFPLLKQMGVFVGFGLIGAWCTVVLLFPGLLKVRQRSLTFTTRLPKAPHWTYPTAVMVLVSIGLVGMFVARPASDLSLFYQPPEFLQADERQLNGLLPVRPSSSYFLVRGANPEQVLKREFALGTRLVAARDSDLLSGFSAISDRLPPTAVQTGDGVLLDTFYGSRAVRDFYLQLGYQPDEIDEITRDLRRPFHDIEFDQWLNNLPDSDRQLWLGCRDGECLSLVRIFGVTGKFAGAELSEGIDGVHYRDPPRAIGEVLAKQRDQLLVLLPVILLIATLVIALRTGWRSALSIVGLPLAAVSLAFAVAAFTSAGINLFHVAALLLVFGIGVDYAVFGHFAVRLEAAYTLLAIILAGITTLLGFGLLALSQTPAIADFGFTLAVGTIATLLLAALYFSSRFSGGNR